MFRKPFGGIQDLASRWGPINGVLNQARLRNVELVGFQIKVPETGFMAELRKAINSMQDFKGQLVA